MSIVESVAEGVLPDAASLEREVVLPTQLTDTEFKKVRKTSHAEEHHLEEAPKRKKKRKSSISEGENFYSIFGRWFIFITSDIDYKKTSKKKLQDDGFFMLDSRTDS